MFKRNSGTICIAPGLLTRGVAKIAMMQHPFLKQKEDRTMKKFWRMSIFALCIFCTVISLGIAQAAGKKEVGFASVSWTGVTIKTELAVKILETLGYEASNTVLPVPIVYKSLDMGDRDVFLGNWMPSMATIANKFFDKGTVVQTVASMPGAKYTLAAPTYVVEGGLKDFADIANTEISSIIKSTVLSRATTAMR